MLLAVTKRTEKMII